MEPLTHDDMIKIRDKALAVLAPFGFEDAGDAARPATLWHTGLRRTFDLSATNPYMIIRVVADEMYNEGYKQAQRDIRKAIGLGYLER